MRSTILFPGNLLRVVDGHRFRQLVGDGPENCCGLFIMNQSCGDESGVLAVGSLMVERS